MSKKQQKREATSGDVARARRYDDWRHAPDVAKLDAASLATLRHFAISEINAGLVAYKMSGDVTHFWRAFLIARRSGIDLPARMLAEVDQLAQAAVDAGRATADEYRDLNGRLRDLWIAACHDQGIDQDPAARPRLRKQVVERVAKTYGVDTVALKMQWSRFWRKLDADERAEVFALQAAWKAGQ